MHETSTREFRANLAEYVQAARDGEVITVRRYTEPAVVVISAEKYEALTATCERRSSRTS